jgi:hypothetical protein
MKIYFLERKQIIPRSRSETFAFFSDEFNLERITPPFLRFRMMEAEDKEEELIERNRAIAGQSSRHCAP